MTQTHLTYGEKMQLVSEVHTDIIWIQSTFLYYIIMKVSELNGFSALSALSNQTFMFQYSTMV